MNVVLIIPTGVGAEIGGHAGDATPVARLLATVCDTLIVHPNVVNASDINEMPSNSLYVEGSILDRFLEGDCRLRSVLANRVLVAVNAPVRTETINAVSAARATLGMEAEIVELETPLRMVAGQANGLASGDVFGWQELVQQIRGCQCDALAVATPIEVSHEVAVGYLRDGRVNPWGGVEAKASRLIADALQKPVAHAPIENEALKGWSEVVDPRKAAEMVSCCYLHCVLKGLHKAPQPDSDRGMSVQEITCLVSPWGCFGRPHRACLAASIPVIAVRENRTVCNDVMPAEFKAVSNYLEAAGVLAAMKAGVHPSAVRRPLEHTNVTRAEQVQGTTQ
jgi:hypothetical protein